MAKAPIHPIFLPRGEAAAAVPVTFVTAATWADLRAGLDARARTFADAAGFEPRAGRHLLLPGSKGALAGVLFAVEAAADPNLDRFRPGALAGLLPAGAYRFANAPHDTRLAALAFALGSYRFTRYRKAEDKTVQLELPVGVDGDDLTRIVEGVALARDLINTPANDLGPPDLEHAARALTSRHGASMRAIVGEDLLTENFPLIHAVGRAAERAPRLIDIGWGDPAHPKVTLIGKGVCFDTGGLGLKTQSRMLHMEKDKGGGAARVALGTEVVPFYTDDEALAAEIAHHAQAESDPLWRLPLWTPYDTLLDSKVADVNNVSSGGFAGSITAALFLRRFVGAAKAWLHCDIYAWNQTSKPGRPEGAECQVARALYALLTERYGRS